MYATYLTGVEEEIAKEVSMSSLLAKNVEKEDRVSASEGQGEYYLNSLNLFPLTRLSSEEESPKITTNMRYDRNKTDYNLSIVHN